jgi:hypothetical protein
MLLETTIEAEQTEVYQDVPENVDDMFDQPSETVAEKTVDASADYQISSKEPAAESTPAEEPQALSAEDMAERLWWDKVEVMGKIKDCARMIQEVESEVDGYQDQIKEAKEVLKGQQALLSRYSSQLADIMDGHPLPKNPNAPVEAPGASDQAPGAAAPGADDWRKHPTDQLLAGVKGMGAKKLEAIMELAPTVGDLEDLRAAASMAHQMFKDVLPKGCGEAMADEIENRICDYTIKFVPRDEPGDEVEPVEMPADMASSGDYEDVE